ncbi:MAG: hypothetical protein RXR19_02630 [Nitrososphaeria archaeon]
MKQALTEVLRICAYPTNEIFNIIVNIESAVKIRKNATTYRCRGSRRRRQEVRE